MEIDLVILIKGIFGDKATYIFVSISIVGYIWCQVRQLISPELMAKLPDFVIFLLEFAAGNKGLASNSRLNDPKHHKRIHTGKF